MDLGSKRHLQFFICHQSEVMKENTLRNVLSYSELKFKSGGSNLLNLFQTTYTYVCSKLRQVWW